jgi:probable F420-dependent oxidoreductase
MAEMKKEFYAKLPHFSGTYLWSDERGPAMQFGITLKPDISVERILGLTRQAEAAGFQYGWIFDSHVLWKEPYPLLTLMAANTQRMRLGTLVTNPAVRDLTVTSSLFATLNLISGGRIELGIGRGDSSRRVLGKKPVSWSQLEAAVRVFRDLTAGREIEYEGQSTRLTWATVSPRVWIAGYGPKVLHMAGRVADGIILQFADPDLISWCLGFVKEGARAAGRDPGQIEVMSAAPVWVSDDLAVARERVRWFPALVSNHVVDLVKRYHDAELPAELTDYIAARERYDYAHHGRTGSENAEFVTDDVVDRFCVLGTPDQVRAKLRELQDLGVQQFNIYSMVDDPRALITGFGRDIIPAFQ